MGCTKGLLRRMKEKFKQEDRTKSRVPGTHNIENTVNHAPKPQNASRTTSQGSHSLWEQAFDKLSAEEQAAILSLIPIEGQPDAAGGEVNKVSRTIQDAIAVMKQHQTEYDETQTDRRELATKVVKHLAQAGDFAIHFVPAPGSQIWPIAKWLLLIPVAAVEQTKELLKIADKVAHAVALGCVYETYYNKTNTPPDGLGFLHRALLSLYKCALQLLAMADHLLAKTGLARAIHVLWSPEHVSSKTKEFANLLIELNNALAPAQMAKTAESDARLNLYLDKWGVSIANIDKTLMKVLKQMGLDEEQKLLCWVSDVEVGNDLNWFINHRVPDTCEWILADKRYQHWESANQSGLIWLRGAVGTGKSFLASKVIQHRQQLLDGPPDQNIKHEGLAFFFFKRDDPKRNTALSCLTSLVKQLSKPHDPALSSLPSLKELHDRCSSQNRSLVPEDCKKRLQLLNSLLPRITIIIDALDECELGHKATGRQVLVEILVSLVQKSGTKRLFNVFVSGRPEGDLLIDLKHHEIIGIEDNHGDIRKFLDTEIHGQDGWEESVKVTVTNAILEKCKSVFRLAELQIGLLIHHECGSDAVSELKALPLNLTDIYDKIYIDQIAQKGETAARIAKRAIMWVLSCPKGLTSHQLLLAIRINPVTSRLGSEENILADDENLDDKVTEDILLKLCANFLIINMWTWQFCHASVSEYFEEHHFSVLEADSLVGAAGIIACLHIYRPAVREDEETETTSIWRDQNHFESWTDHVRLVDQSMDVEADKIQDCKAVSREEHSDVLVSMAQLRALLRRFLGHPNRVSKEYLPWAKHKGIYRDQPPMYSSACFAMIKYGFINLLQSWWDSLPLSKAGNTNYETNDYPVIDTTMVIEHPEWNEEGCWNLLQWACYCGNAEIVKKLIVEGGMDANEGVGGTQSPLSIACWKGHLEVCRTLLGCPGCDPDVPRNLWNPLYQAARRNELDIIRCLLRHDAKPDPSGWEVDVGKTFFPGSPLAATIDKRYGDAMQVLIDEAGADPNTAFPNADEGSAMITAARKLNFDALHYLVRQSQGCDHSNTIITTGKYGSILSGVIQSLQEFSRCPPDVLDRLAALRVNFNASLRYPPTRDYAYGSVLEFFAGEGDLEKVKDLVENHGAEVDYCSEHGVYGSVLIAGIRAHGYDLLRYWKEDDWRWTLSSEVQDVSEEDNRARRALLCYLVETAHAQVNLQVHHGEYHSPLAGAAVLSGLEEMDYLIQKGALVNLVLEYGQHRSAIMAAAAAGKETAVQFLVEKGADINRPENQGLEMELELGLNRQILLRP